MEKLKPPKGIVHISGFREDILTIIDRDNKLLVKSKIQGEHAYDNDTYRCLLISRVKDCKIILKTKVLKILFMDMKDTMITVRCSSIGPIEMFRCRNMKVHLMREIPFLYSENVINCHAYQLSEEQKYVLHFCFEYTCHVLNKDRTQRLVYDFGKYFWKEQELDMYTVTRENGQTLLQLSLVLNEIKQYLLKNEEF